MKKYPIYTFNAKWSQIGKQDPDYPNSYKDLPEGYIWNATGFHRMFKEEQTEEQLEKFINEWWNKYKESDKFKESNINNVELNYKFKFNETFVCTWFGHECYDDGQTDEEFLNEFEQYVSRHENYQDINNMREPYICLMGAEDRWRWNSGNKEYTGIPCRCKYCKEQGVLRIAH